MERKDGAESLMNEGGEGGKEKQGGKVFEAEGAKSVCVCMC